MQAMGGFAVQLNINSFGSTPAALPQVMSPLAPGMTLSPSAPVVACKRHVLMVPDSVRLIYLFAVGSLTNLELPLRTILTFSIMHVLFL